MTEENSKSLILEVRWMLWLACEVIIGLSLLVICLDFRDGLNNGISKDKLSLKKEKPIKLEHELQKLV